MAARRLRELRVSVDALARVRSFGVHRLALPWAMTAVVLGIAVVALVARRAPARLGDVLPGRYLFLEMRVVEAGRSGRTEGEVWTRVDAVAAQMRARGGVGNLEPLVITSTGRLHFPEADVLLRSVGIELDLDAPEPRRWVNPSMWPNVEATAPERVELRLDLRSTPTELVFDVHGARGWQTRIRYRTRPEMGLPLPAPWPPRAAHLHP